LLGLYDLGPPGCAVQSNILHAWRQHFVLEEQMLEVDCTIMTKDEVFKYFGNFFFFFTIARSSHFYSKQDVGPR